MATTLATIQGRVEQKLGDTGNDIWSSDDLAEAIRAALHEYSKTRPLQAVTTLELSATAREIDISSVTGLLSVVDIWVPYTEADPEYPPNRRSFRHWSDLSLLYVTGDYEPESGEVMRIFYTTLQTLKDLDSATATSIPTDDETLLVTGAAGHAATSRAVDLAEQVTIDRLTAQQVRAWGLNQLQEFRAGLRRVARQTADDEPAFVELPPMDKWAGVWS